MKPKLMSTTFDIEVYSAVQGGLSLSVSNQMNASESYLSVLLFIKLFKAILTFVSVDENLRP